MILLKATTLDSTTFYSISSTCRRFKTLLNERKEHLLPMVHIDFPEHLYNGLPRRSNKIKVSVRELSRRFGPSSGIIECISKGVTNVCFRKAKQISNQKLPILTWRRCIGYTMKCTSLSKRTKIFYFHKTPG